MYLKEVSLLSVVTLYVDTKTPVLLQTATTGVLRPDSSSPVIQARMILDSGCQRSYITNRLKTALSLPTEQVDTMLIKTFGAVEKKRQNCDVVRLAMKTKTGENLELAFLAVPLICEPLSGQPIMCVSEQFPHISGLDLADPHFSGENLDVNILIGSDHYWEVVTGNVMRGVCEPTAIETKFGWVLSGPEHGFSSEQSVANLVSSHVLRLDASPNTTESEANLDMRLKKFWDLESVDGLTFCNNRYKVKLPWKESHSTLPDNDELSQNRLRGLLKRLQHSPDILRQYDAVIREQMDKGNVEVVAEPDIGKAGKVHYIPHHPVIRLDKATTKLRVVYDASARSQGPSLNDCLLAGPNFGQSIVDIILRFRLHKIALVGDIEKAFLTVSVDEEDRDVLRFLWLDDIEKELPKLVVMRFTRVVFGVLSSPFLLNTTIHHRMKQYESMDAPFIQKFERSIYVDDVTLVQMMKRVCMNCL